MWNVYDDRQQTTFEKKSSHVTFAQVSQRANNQSEVHVFHFNETSVSTQHVFIPRNNIPHTFHNHTV